MRIGSPEWKELIRSGAAELDVAVTDAMADGFAEHGRTLLAWNRKTNLTAITDPAAVAVKHFVDSLAPAPWIARGARLLDIGSGGGFPGIPLKVARPDLTVTLVDAVRKKVSFLQQVIRILGLEGITARHVRAEALIRTPDAAGTFDIVVCRALGDLTGFLITAAPLVAPGGAALALKGRLGQEEQGRAEDAVQAGHKDPPGTPGWRPQHVDVRRYRLPVLDADRALVWFR